MLDLESLFKLCYGMSIVSSEKDGRFNGCIVNTVFQLTPEPPMIGVSVNRQCLTHDYIVHSRVFTVSVLSQNTPKSFIGLFGFRSGRDIDKFKSVKYRLGRTGVPIVLDNTVAFLEADVRKDVELNSHTLFIAEVVACETIDYHAEPMTYSYYRDIKHGRTPKTAATYVARPWLNHRNEGTLAVTERSRIMKKYKCLMCGYIYDPAVGDPDNGVEPGTTFEDLPDGWVCPDCGAGIDEFEPIED